MPTLIEYIIKLFICQAIVFLFYQLVLRKHTFYTWNRWYLLGYSLLSFLIPFIDITPVLESNQMAAHEMMYIIPSVDVYTHTIDRVTQCPVPIWSATWDKWDWALLVFACGACYLFARFVLRCISFFNMRRKAKLVSAKGVKLYQVEGNIIPFSFGNSIFINHRLHDEKDLPEIIRHEFVHVKQKHTHDIIWSEIVCILNWYNPFAWLIRRAIRQNLEFIADHQVLENGLDRKQYQYMLLKVVGNDHFRIGSQFNFSSLKKRIIMMNKVKSARPHLLKFLFILPLMAVILLAFRNENDKQQPAGEKEIMHPAAVSTDSIPAVAANAKGYYIDIIDKSGECMVIIKDKNKKEVERLPLTKWNANEDYYEGLYGIILPPPPPPPSMPPPPRRTMPDNVESMHVRNNLATVTLKDGTREKYDLNKPDENAAFEKKYGKMPPPPAPPAPAMPPTSSLMHREDNIAVAVNIETSSPTIVMAVSPTPANVEIGTTTMPVKIKATTAVSTQVTGAAVGTTAVAVTPQINVPAVAANGVKPGLIGVDGEPVLELRIYKFFTREKLNALVAQAKAKGIELEFNDVNYNKNNQITRIVGKLEKENLTNNFSISDFQYLTIIVRKRDGQYFSFIQSSDDREEI